MIVATSTFVFSSRYFYRDAPQLEAEREMFEGAGSRPLTFFTPSRPHPRIEGKRLGFSHEDLVEVRVQRIDQIIPFCRDDSRWDREHGASGGLDPRGAEIGQRCRRWIGSPVPRQADPWQMFEAFDGAPWNICRNRNEVVRHLAWTEVDEVLEHCERERRGSVDNASATTVPPPSRETRALAVQCRVPAPTHAPDTNQL